MTLRMGRTSGDRIGPLDSLRAIAAGLVLFQHLFEKRAGVGQSIIPILSPGVAGVAIFFFVSGYVIPMSVRRGFDARAFAVRRIFRIYPLYLAALACVLAVALARLAPTFGWVLTAAPRTWIVNLLLLQDYVGAPAVLGVSWTLPIEFAWYGLFALALALSPSRALVILTLATASLVSGIRVPLGRFSMIYAAAIGFEVYRYGTGLISGARLGLAIAAFVAIVTYGGVVAFGVFHHARLSLAQVVLPWAGALALFLAVMLVPALRDARVFRTGLLPAWGAVSYSTYLLHPIAIQAALAQAPGGWVVPIALAGTLLLSILGYRLIERPGIQVGRTLAMRWTATRVATAPA